MQKLIILTETFEQWSGVWNHYPTINIGGGDVFVTQHYYEKRGYKNITYAEWLTLIEKVRTYAQSEVDAIEQAAFEAGQAYGREQCLYDFGHIRLSEFDAPNFQDYKNR